MDVLCLLCLVLLVSGNRAVSMVWEGVVLVMVLSVCSSKYAYARRWLMEPRPSCDPFWRAHGVCQGPSDKFGAPRIQKEDFLKQPVPSGVGANLMTARSP